MPSSWRGGPGCQCDGPDDGCPHPLACCVREGGPGRARAARERNAAGTLTLCLACAGEATAARPWQLKKRPAAAPRAANAKAKPAPNAPVAAPEEEPAEAPAAAALPQPAPAAPAAAVAAAAAAPPALLEAYIAALDRHSTALEAHTRALEAHAARRAPPADAVAGPGVAEATGATAAAAVRAGSGGLPRCPLPLQPLKAAVDAALAGDGQTSGGQLLRAARVGTSAAAWARLRALVVVYHHADAARVADLQLERRGNSQNVAERWMQQRQLHQLVVTTGSPAPTLLNHVARHLQTNPPLRERFGARLLADAATLA